MKSSDIKNIELITNPGAEYGSNVQAVIRIKTKPRQGDGWGISTYSFANFSRIVSGFQSLSVKYNHEGLELFSRLQIHSLHNKQYSSFEQIMQGRQLLKEVGNDTIFNNGDKQFYGQIGINYDLKKNHSFDLVYSLTKSLHDQTNASSSLNFSHDDITQERVMMRTVFSSNHTPDHEIDTYYTGQIGRLNLNFNGTFYRSKQTRSQENEEVSDRYGNRKIDVYNTTRNSMLAAKLIATYPIGNGRLNVGSEFVSSKSNGLNFNAQNVFNESNTQIKENNIAGFVEMNYSLGKFQLRGGMRFEHVVSDYYDQGKWQGEASRKYNEWFPNLSISWSKGLWRAFLGYSSKTQRPSYRMLSSWMQYDNRYEYQGGNMLLRPASIHTLDLTVTRNWLSFSAGYTRTHNVVAYILKPYTNDIFIKTYQNLNRLQELYAVVTAAPRFGCYQPLWEVRLSKPFLKDDDFSNNTDLGKPQFYFRLNNRFTIKPTFIAAVSLSYHTAYANALSVNKSGGSLDINITKYLFNNKLALYFNARDILNTQIRKYTMYGIMSSFTIRQDMDSRCVSVGIQYNFNSSRSKYKGSGAGNTEKGRM